MLTLIETVPSSGKTPRFTIDPSGRFMLVGNENSDNVVVFHMDRKSGRLTKISEIAHVISPIGFALLAARWSFFSQQILVKLFETGADGRTRLIPSMMLRAAPASPRR